MRPFTIFSEGAAKITIYSPNATNRTRPGDFSLGRVAASVVDCVVEVMSILKGGNKERTQEPTAANRTSSRSHAVLIVSVKQRQRVAGIQQQVRVGKLFLIDLAGSERAANTQNRGKRMIEGAHINRSLLALGNCINALSTYIHWPAS